jgi:hypothetical protein
LLKRMMTLAGVARVGAALAILPADAARCPTAGSDGTQVTFTVTPGALMISLPGDPFRFVDQRGGWGQSVSATTIRRGDTVINSVV